MKKPSFTPSLNPIMALLAACVVLFSSGLSVYGQQIASRPLTPREIDIYALPDDTMTSGGLKVVGIGESIYLEAQVPKGTVTNGVEWSIVSRPLGGSVAELLPTPILPEMPIFSQGDRAILEVAGRTHFIPDLEGKYMIQAIVSTDDEPITLETQVTGAFYVGAGVIDGASPSYPQCGLCHEENALSYIDTGHATAFEQQIDGMGSSHFNESCVSCHSLGKGDGDVSGSFFEVAADTGWTFPETLEPGNWDAMPAELQAMANVQCEHCHGAGSIHHGDITTTAVSLSSGDCGQCHDAEPYHVINQQWDLSEHAVATRYPTGPGRGSCVECHSGVGFIEEMDGVIEKSTDYEAIVCAACHDPHSAENKHQVRTVADVTLENGHIVEMGGTGKLCLNCHKGRQDAESYVEGDVSSHFGPHRSVQGDMFNGTNGIEYGKVMSGASAHLYAVEDSCVGCHMQSVDSDNPAANMAGGHTFKMVWDGETPDDHDDDMAMVGACVDCHGPVDDF
ncbi:MAG: cytochrome c3 family protein, partial [Oceanipulchritudo sp.]